MPATIFTDRCMYVAFFAAAFLVKVIRRYYAAINARDFPGAYELWEDEASGQTFEEFAAGFQETARVDVEIGAPGRIEPAAGSRFVNVPVEMHAVTTTGEEQRFEGTYTLRRSVVEEGGPASLASVRRVDSARALNLNVEQAIVYTHSTLRVNGGMEDERPGP